MKAARVAFEAVLDKPDQNVGAPIDSYGMWRRQQAKHTTDRSVIESDATFLVYVEVGDDPADSSAFRRTQGSVLNQAGTEASVVAVRHGSALDVHDVTEDFVLFLRAGSLLNPYALADIAQRHRVDPALSLIVFDSDVRSRNGRRADPLFRPAWSPETLLGANYIGRAFAMRGSLLRKRQLVTISDQGIWQLLLDANFEERSVGNVHRVLLTEDARPSRAATAADAEMVRASMARRGESLSTAVENGIVRVRFEPPAWPSVSIVIPSRHSRTNLGRLLPSLATTDYPDFDVTVVDNGGRSEDNDSWYQQVTAGLDFSVTWWTDPFNYSRVNNVTARGTQGDVLVFLNDDTEIVDPGWLREMVGMLLRDGVGSVGVQHRRGDGLIQHGGVVLGPGGFADNLFSGMAPGSDTLIGPTTWYRNSLAVTAACVAIQRDHFEQVGGFDERFKLTGSDVVLGLDQVINGRRNVVLPFDTVRHLESVTRGTSVPFEDFYASYWRYHPWLAGEDPYSSPNVSRLSAVPTFRKRNEVSPVKLALTVIGRNYGKVAQSLSISEEAIGLLRPASITAAEVAEVHRVHTEVNGPIDIQTINWFIPDIDMPFFGGLNTAFRLADKLRREHGVLNRFVVLSGPNEAYVRSALAAAFPGLGDSEIVFYGGQDSDLAALPPADAAVATLWLTAMHVAKAPGVKRKFYLMQDYEPAFYPASTLYAMAEESYRLGLYGICNTQSMYDIYTGHYGGQATVFTPAVDRNIYHPEGRRTKAEDEPVTIFAYARDHFRNCWELVFAALKEIKRMHGDRVRIVAAGARYLPESADFIDMGLLDYRATGRLYREADIGLTMQISRHPSYLPLELMASGVPMVAPDSMWFEWLFTKDENSLLTMRSLDDLVTNLDRLVTDRSLRERLQREALSTIDAKHSDWDAALDHVYQYMCDPE